MDLSLEGTSFDASKNGKRSVGEKRELVYELSKWPGASEVLQTWSRQEILQVLCAEMGKERKYTGLTKFKMIEQLLKIVSEKMVKCDTATDVEPVECHENVQRPSKRQRKTDNPTRFPVQVNSTSSNGTAEEVNTVYCKNSACKAALRQDDTFCKRCSCCICNHYDDNKDPSLWLSCISEPPFQGPSCGMSCHLECALKHSASGIGKYQHGTFDGSFRCSACGKVNDMIGCWRKQLVAAKDTRRVDMLCYRLSLCHKLLMGSVKYQQLHKIVDEAVKELEADVGPLSGVPAKMGRGIVNRLSSGREVQKRCALALKSLDKLLASSVMHQVLKSTTEDVHAQTKVRFEDVTSKSVSVVVSYDGPSVSSVVGYTLWHRKSCEAEYETEPTCTMCSPNTKFEVDDLSPNTEYLFKVVSSNDVKQLGTCEAQCITSSIQEEHSNCSERIQSPVTNCSSLSNPSSVEDESNHNTQCGEKIAITAADYLGYKSGETMVHHLSCTAVNQGGADGIVSPPVTSVIDSEHNIQVDHSHSSDDQNKKMKCLQDCQRADLPCPDKKSESLIELERVLAGKFDASLPITPCKLEVSKDIHGRLTRSNKSNHCQSHGGMDGDEPQDGSTSKKRGGEKGDEECTANNHSARDLEYYVKVIRWLECQGHLEKNFRQKFLTWYSLRASPEEVRIVKAFVDTLIEDPASLAEQLVDTFSGCVSSRDHTVVPAGFCMKLWH